ncbi:MAG: hypothetical protein HC828_14755, partial [Blastochloris sp.]|nr:hypothetical protein [Blastochloris sp.]
MVARQQEVVVHRQPAERMVCGCGDGKPVKVDTDYYYDPLPLMYLDPVWSPDGTQIAFVSEQDGNPEIYVMYADGSQQTRLTHTPETDYQPTWSPDGGTAYYGNGNTLIRAQGTSTQSVGNVNGDLIVVEYAPDGGTVLFASNNQIRLLYGDG